MTFLHTLAVGSTVFRLSSRIRRSCMWWDDYVVVIPLCVDIFFCVALWMYPTLTEIPISDNVHTVDYWFSLFPCFTVVWLSRISLALSLARIFPPWHVSRYFALALASLFVVLYAICLLLTLLACDGFRVNPNNCVKTLGGHNVADLLGDTLLILCPLFTLWRIKLPASERRMVLVVFSTSALTLIEVTTFVVFNYASFDNGRALMVIIPMLGHMEAAISLIVCNLLVVVSFFYRAFRKAQDTSQPLYLQDRPRHRNQSVLSSMFTNINRLPDTGLNSNRSQSGLTSPIAAEVDDERLTYIDLTKISDGYIDTESLWEHRPTTDPRVAVVREKADKGEPESPIRTL
ncbi:hypothetical protein B0H34DRAFT_652361 [Crassisporium funariophilum]|nr:hypothetical protein B0H34DRAFT_652361 [Crassisporium funariophilum]